MKRTLWVQMVGFSLLIALIFGLVGLTAFRWITVPANNEARKNIYLFLANLLESAPYPESMRMLERFRVESKSLASNIWIISDKGDVLATNTALPLPPEWKTIPTPRHTHEMTFKFKSSQLFADMTLVRLAAPQPTFALVKPRESTPNKTVARVEIILFIFGMFGATSVGIGMTFLYLRKTSLEAKDVMSRLHAGDLQARFSIRKLDEIGSLKLDFNTMADEIERLVQRVQKTEAARKNLLHELSHDLRTPLTSLRTSVETLAAYHEQMSVEQQREFLCVTQSELNYFVRLLEDLFFIADIAEPGYRGAIETIDINALLNTEVQARQLAQPQLQWHLHCSTPMLTLAGDAHLLLRLIRNTLDNAAKYANTRIDISASEVRSGVNDAVQSRLEIVIADDGPGMSTEALQTFGERRKYRVRQSSTPLDLSLGLGSVIIKTIVDLHDGELRIQSSALDTSIAQGTRFIFSFPQKI